MAFLTYYRVIRPLCFDSGGGIREAEKGADFGSRAANPKGNKYVHPPETPGDDVLLI